MAYIEGQAVLSGIPRPGVRAHLYFRNEAGIRTGARLSTEVTGQGVGGRATQTIFTKGRFYFGGLTTGNYIVYLQGVGFDAEKNPVHRMPFDIVDDAPVPDTALLFSGGTLFLFGNQSSAVTLSYEANLVSKPAELGDINVGEGLKLAGIEAGADVNPRVSIYTDAVVDIGSGAGNFVTHTKAGAGYFKTHRFFYTHDFAFTKLEWITEAKISVSGQTGHIKLEVFLIDGISSQGSTVLDVTANPNLATHKLLHSVASLIVDTRYMIEIYIEGTANPSTIDMVHGGCDALRS